MFISTLAKRKKKYFTPEHLSFFTFALLAGSMSKRICTNAVQVSSSYTRSSYYSVPVSVCVGNTNFDTYNKIWSRDRFVGAIWQFADQTTCKMSVDAIKSFTVLSATVDDVVFGSCTLRFNNYRNHLPHSYKLV